jgi:hypothetical protein
MIIKNKNYLRNEKKAQIIESCYKKEKYGYQFLPICIPKLLIFWSNECIAFAERIEKKNRS